VTGRRRPPTQSTAIFPLLTGLEWCASPTVMPSVHPPAVLHELARRTEEAKGTKVVMSDAYGIGVGDPTVMVATPPRMSSRLPTGARWCFHLRGISPSPLLTRPAKIEARLEVTVKPRSGVASSSLPGGQRQANGLRWRD
jgi:hypothetical protein